MYTLFTEELPNLSEDTINWTVKNVVSNALFEVKYQIFSEMETTNEYFEYSSKAYTKSPLNHMI